MEWNSISQILGFAYLFFGGQNGNFKNLRSTRVLGRHLRVTKSRPHMMLERSCLKELFLSALNGVYKSNISAYLFVILISLVGTLSVSIVRWVIEEGPRDHPLVLRWLQRYGVR